MTQNPPGALRDGEATPVEGESALHGSIDLDHTRRAANGHGDLTALVGKGSGGSNDALAVDGVKSPDERLWIGAQIARHEAQGMHAFIGEVVDQGVEQIEDDGTQHPDTV